MKKYIILGATCLCCGCVFYHYLSSNQSIANLDDKKIATICQEWVVKEVIKEKEQWNRDITFRRQRDMEEICICIAKKMPRSMTVSEFENLRENYDERSRDISNDCIEELIESGIISEEDA